MRRWAGPNSEPLHQARLDAQAGHAFDGQRQHRVQTVFKAEIEQLSGGHPQRQGSEGINEQPRQDGGQRLGVVKVERQHRAAPLQSQGRG
jgi:hypothetical protein